MDFSKATSVTAGSDMIIATLAALAPGPRIPEPASNPRCLTEDVNLHVSALLP